MAAGKATGLDDVLRAIRATASAGATLAAGDDAAARTILTGALLALRQESHHVLLGRPNYCVSNPNAIGII
jgi:hypothetical protein